MGHLRLGVLSQSKKWREVASLLEAGAPLEGVAAAAAEASERDLNRASGDPVFQFVSRVLVELPLRARSPGFESAIGAFGLSPEDLKSLPAFLASLSRAIDRHAFEIGQSSDAGILAKSALLESLSVQLGNRLPSLFEPTSADIRAELARFSGGQNFAVLARDFFARLTYRSLDYYLSRELANHTGEGHRFSADADRVAFQQALATHTFEASKIVEEFAGGWYGKTIWQQGALDQKAINGFTSYAFKKLRDEFGRRRADA